MSELFPYVLVNGHQSHNISIFDRGFAYGDGVFETMAYSQGQLPLWQWHRERLLRSCRFLSIPIDESILAKQLQQICDYGLKRQLRSGIIKLVVTRGQGGYGYIPPSACQPTVVLSLRPLEASTGGAQLTVCQHKLSRNASLAGIKHLNRLDYIIAAQQLSDTSKLQGLLLDTEDFVIETLHHNIFMVKDQQLLTPTLDYCGVNGVLRRYLLEIVAPQLLLSIQERPLKLEDFLFAEEIFITNAVRGVVWVEQLNDKHWSEGVFTQQLQNQINPLLGLM